MPPPSFPNTQVDSVDAWFNFHHTIEARKVPTYLTPGALASTGEDTSSTRRNADALRSILTWCMQTQKPAERLCIIGAKWSMSNVLDPANVILDPGVYNKIARVSPQWLTADYQTKSAAKGGVPVVVQGGTQIGALNQTLGAARLALQTSGAADGHRLAGCIATGTHGSALKIGAVHDTALAVFLVTGPDTAVLVQPSTRNFTGALTQWFIDSTGIPTTDLADDTAFAAAQVALGSLGFVHSVVMEAVPLYQLSGVNLARELLDADVWEAIETLDTRKLDPVPDPYTFSLVMQPYAKEGQLGAFVNILWKNVTPPGVPFTSAHLVPAMAPSDVTQLVAKLAGKIDSGLAAPILEQVLVSQTQNAFTTGRIQPTFPGTAFGPTSLPPGAGRSTEVVVDHQHASAALEAILTALRSEGAQGRHLLGAIGVRFVPGSTALLATNQRPMNMYVEIPTIGGPFVSAIHGACWAALRAAKIPFTCHWGQLYGMDAASVAAYYGDKVTQWKAVRAQLLPTPEAKMTFSTPLLFDVGLG